MPSDDNNAFPPYTKTLNGVNVFNSVGKLYRDKNGMPYHISTIAFPDGMYVQSTKIVIKKHIVMHKEKKWFLD
jgi:hypothetical protein